MEVGGEEQQAQKLNAFYSHFATRAKKTVALAFVWSSLVTAYRDIDVL